MGDKVTCTAVLQKAVDPERFDYLFLVVDKGGPRMLPCRKEGLPRLPGESAQWSYREDGNTIHLHPSLLATDTGFHTDYNWTCAYVLNLQDEGQSECFYRVNPDIEPWWKATEQLP